MRKALLVIAMVAASFLGGAVVNGPGLAWLAGALGLEPIKVEPLGPDALDREAEGVEVADKATSDPEKSAAPLPKPRPAPEMVAAESLREEEEPTAVAKADPIRQPEPEPASEPEPPQPLSLGSQPPPLEPPAVGLQTEPEPETKRAESKVDSPLEPGWGDAPGSAPALAFLPGLRGSQPPADPDVVSASVPPNDPEPASTEAEPPATEEAEKPGGGDPADVWAKLHDRMSAMGVSRYWVEGEPSGVVRFRCVVPLAAGGAVAQQFEAEGDDLPSAVEATLKRIDLWRATEAEPRP